MRNSEFRARICKYYLFATCFIDGHRESRDRFGAVSVVYRCEQQIACAFYTLSTITAIARPTDFDRDNEKNPDRDFPERNYPIFIRSRAQVHSETKGDNYMNLEFTTNSYN